jgi:hypothetical protein
MFLKYLEIWSFQYVWKISIKKSWISYFSFKRAYVTVLKNSFLTGASMSKRNGGMFFLKYYVVNYKCPIFRCKSECELNKIFQHHKSICNCFVKQFSFHVHQGQIRIGEILWNILKFYVVNYKCPIVSWIIYFSFTRA